MDDRGGAGAQKRELHGRGPGHGRRGFGEELPMSARLNHEARSRPEVAGLGARATGPEEAPASGGPDFLTVTERSRGFRPRRRFPPLASCWRASSLSRGTGPCIRVLALRLHDDRRRSLRLLRCRLRRLELLLLGEEEAHRRPAHLLRRRRRELEEVALRVRRETLGVAVP